MCHSRKEEFVTVYPADVVLFEGILMFYSQEIRDLFQMKLFVDTDPDTRLSRRGVCSDSLCTNFKDLIAQVERKMFTLYVLPSHNQILGENINTGFLYQCILSFFV